MTALRALLAAMPDICRALDQIDVRWQDRAFDALCNAALTDAQQQQTGYDTVAPTYDPSRTTVMDTYRGDPLSTGR